MNDIQGTYRDGHVDLDRPVNWPNGSRVAVSQVSVEGIPAASDTSDWGIDEADYRDTHEFRAKLIGQMDTFEPLELTPAEEAEWEAARQWIKDYTIAAVRTQMGL